jgi:hypothetical protein
VICRKAHFKFKGVALWMGLEMFCKSFDVPCRMALLPCRRALLEMPRHKNIKFMMTIAPKISTSDLR